MTGRLAWLASGGPVPVPPGGGADIHVNSALITALVIGIPSTVVAVGSYWLSVRARREAAATERGRVDATAYARARELYESAIGQLRQQVAEGRAEIARLNAELARLRREVAARTRRR